MSRSLRARSSQDRVMAFLFRWGVLCVAVWIAASVVTGIRWEGWQSIVAVALILGLLNVLVRPVLFWISLPLTVVTFGLFLIILNAFLLWLTGRIAEDFSQLHFSIDHFWWDAVFGAIIISAVSWLLGVLISPPKRLML